MLCTRLPGAGEGQNAFITQAQPCFALQSVCIFVTIIINNNCDVIFDSKASPSPVEGWNFFLLEGSRDPPPTCVVFLVPG